MQKKQPILSLFLFFLFLSLITFFLSGKQIIGSLGFIGNGLFPMQALVYSIVSVPFLQKDNQEISKIREENRNLQVKLTHMLEIEKENQALHDQFQTTTITSSSLLPAYIIGMPSFLPGVSLPEEYILNKGKDDGIGVGNVVLYENNVIGEIAQITSHASLVMLISNKKSSFTAQTLGAMAEGVIQGEGNGQLTLDNVLLSDTLRIGDTVVTHGSQDLIGKGFPPGLVVGKIMSVEKNPSNLFQKASVKSLLSFGNLSVVFVMKGGR